MNLDLQGKVVLISGGSKGLGLAVARCCKAEGAKVVIGSRDQANLDIAQRDLEATLGGAVLAVPLDMSSADSITRWVAAAVARFGTVDGLLVNAGGPPPGMFDNFDDSQWQAGFELTLLSAVRLIRAALPALRKNGGSILTLTSVAVKEPIDILLMSNVMRAGVNSLAKSLARNLAVDGIRVNNLMPGLINTDRIKEVDTLMASVGGVSTEQQRARQEANIPLGRYGEPMEFGRVGAFLLSPAASYITGTTLAADGGMIRAV